jgi:D-alanyl-D-alanine carboxypeptidase
MTSGLPNYSDAPLMNAELFQHPDKQWKDAEIIAFVYPQGTFSPPLKDGYAYTNTGYILTAMVIEAVTQHNFQTEIENRLIKPAELANTFYPLPTADQQIHSRLASGYGYNPYLNPELVGKDVSTSSLSWAGAAGAVISNANDIVKWVKALYIDNKILDPQQKKQLMQLVSTATGKPIPATSSQDPRAFALGVTSGYDKNIGRYWFYEGQTEGFRALYMYVPGNGIIIASIFNSAVNGENDHAGELMQAIYKIAKQKAGGSGG